MKLNAIKRLPARVAGMVRSQGGVGPFCSKLADIVRREGMGGITTRVKGRLEALRLQLTAGAPIDTQRYTEWREAFDTLTNADHAAIRGHIASLNLPALTVVIHAMEGRPRDLTDTLESVRSQLYENWRALVVVNARTAEAVKQAAAGDSRFDIISAQACNAGTMATLHGSPLVLMRAPVQLREHALYLYALEMAAGRAFAYSDSDRKRGDGALGEPFFKPGFSPELAKRLNYFGDCVCLAAPDANAQGALREFLTGHTPYDALLRRLTQRLNRQSAARIPFVLFHEYRDSRNPQLDLEPEWLADDALPRFSIIIPTRNGLNFLRPCVQSIVATSDYPRERYEIIIIDNGSDDAQTLHFLREQEAAGTVRVLPDPRPFNFAALNNAAARIATGDVLLFLNNDVVIRDAKWLRRMAVYAMQNDVGAVGGKLLYPDLSMQHGGVVVGIQAVAAHAHHQIPATEHGHHYFNSLAHEMAAVTGACLAMRRDVFEEIGGFNESFAVAFNDTVLCLDALARGYRNLFIPEPLLIHFESKTRGYDDTDEKAAQFRREARRARALHPDYFADDPYYNPNLSFEHVYHLARPSRALKPWLLWERSQRRQRRFLFLSVTHQIGHGVPVVLKEQVEYLAQQGHVVYVGGPRGNNDFTYAGCERIEVEDPRLAAAFAAQHNIDAVVAHTPPFFSTFRWLGSGVLRVAFDHGEPTPEFFPDAPARRATLSEKHLSLGMADLKVAISEAIRAESGEPDMVVVRNANSHLNVWGPEYEPVREATRERLGWADKVVVLNVCRFHRSERHYKGIDAYVALHEAFVRTHPEAAGRVVFALCGKGTEKDVADMRAQGLAVFPNVTDEEMTELYAAADLYANMSKWEGYNLGIGQALAMGLPVVASDIPAHREFGVFVSNDENAAADELARLAAALPAPAGQRKAVVWQWRDAVERLANLLEQHLTGRPPAA